MRDNMDKKATVRKFRTVQNEGGRNVSRTLLHYNLDMIISIGYRVNSLRGTQFRIWANKILKEFTRSHDRFLIIDRKTIYHIGASLKDLGKKWFAFSIIDFEVNYILKRLNAK